MDFNPIPAFKVVVKCQVKSFAYSEFKSPSNLEEDIG